MELYTSLVSFVRVLALSHAGLKHCPKRNPKNTIHWHKMKSRHPNQCEVSLNLQATRNFGDFLISRVGSLQVQHFHQSGWKEIDCMDQA